MHSLSTKIKDQYNRANTCFGARMGFRCINKIQDLLLTNDFYDITYIFAMSVTFFRCCGGNSGISIKGNKSRQISAGFCGEVQGKCDTL
jgi:hypothetical protein